MKKQNAIIALLLVVSLLVSSMTIFVSAQTTAGDTKSNASTGSTENTRAEQTPAMKEDLVSSKNGKVDITTLPIYATDKAGSIISNILDGPTASLFVSADNEGSGYGIFDTYSITYGQDKFIRFSLTEAGLAANGGKIKRGVKFGVTSSAYGTFAMEGVVGDMNASLATVKNYFVYDFEFATEYLVPKVNMMPIVRVAKNGTYALANQNSFSLDNFAKYMDDGKWAHITLVGDIQNNAIYTFVNGALISSGKIISAFPDKTIAYDTIRFEGIRMETTNPAGAAGMNLYMDNLAVRYYNADQAARAGLDKAIASKQISEFSDHYDDKGTQLPPVATVNGVVYNTTSDVSAVLSGNTQTPYNVDILRSFSGKIAVNADAVINTHGLTGLGSFTFSENAHYEMEDGYITVDAPFVANSLLQKPTSKTEYTNKSLSGALGNQAIGVSTDLNNNLLIRTNVDDGSQCLEFNFLNASVDYVNVLSFNTTTGQYKLKDYPYGLISFDLVSFSSNMKGSFYMLGRASGPLSWPAFTFSGLLDGIPVGEVAQFTFAFGLSDPATGTYEIRVFRNGEYFSSSSFKTTDPKAHFEAIRLQPNGGHFAIDNVYSVTSSTTIFDANGNLLDEFDQFSLPGYQKLSLPSVAIVDGVVASAADKVSAILNSNALIHQQNVTINHNFSGKIAINVGAVIETNGFVGLDSFVFGDGVTYVQQGTKIITTAPLSLGDKVATEAYSGTTFTFPTAEVLTPDNQYITNVSYTNKIGQPLPSGDKKTQTYFDVKSVTSIFDGSKYYGLVVSPKYLETNNKTDLDTFISFNPSSKNTYAINPKAGDANAIMATADEAYYVYDLDLYIDADFLPSMRLSFLYAWANAAGSKKGDYCGNNAFVLKDVISAGYEGWAHLTVVGDVKNNICHIYVNGEHVKTNGFISSKPSDTYINEITSVKIADFRLGVVTGASLYENGNLFFDNASLRSFDGSETALANAIKTKSSLNGWDKNHTIPSSEGSNGIVASVDGQPFFNVEEAVKYALDNKAKNLSIYSEYTGILEIDHDIKIYVMNGELKYISKTHAVTEDNGLYTFTKDDRALNTVYVVYDRFTFEDNGGIGGYEAVKFGSGSQFVYQNDAFVNTTYYNGKYYTFNGKWTYETSDGVCEFTGVVTDDCNFKLLIPQYDTVDAECMFSYKLNGADITLANSVDELKALLNSEYTTLDVTLYEDIRYDAGIEVKGALNLNLNGNDLIFTTLSAAGFTLSADNSSLAISSAKAGATIHYTNANYTASDYLIVIMASNCNVTVNGRNLSVYTGALLSDSTGTGNTVTVKDGAFYRVLSTMYSYVTVKGGTTVDITGATFVDTLNDGVWFATAAGDTTVFDDVAINVNRCTVIGLDGTALVRESSDKNGNYAAIKFENLTYLANSGKFSYDDNVSDAVSIGTGSFTNVEIPEDAVADGLKLLYQNKTFTNKLYYPAYVNGAADYTLTESQHTGTATYKIGSPYAITVNGMKYNLTLYSHFNVNLYIPVSEANKFVDGTFDGVATRDIDGIEHYVFTISVNANSIGDDVTFRFLLVNNEAYNVTVNIVNYAANVLGNTKGDDPSYTARLMVSMLEYASSVYAYENKDNSELLAVIEANEKYRATTDGFGSAVDTTKLKQFLTSASMYLHESPSFIFKLRDDFNGTVKVQCGTFANTVNSAQSKTIVLSGLRITDVQNTITLTFTTADGQTTVCTYNLATYYKGLEGNDIATVVLNSLRNYSNIARAYVMAANNK